MDESLQRELREIRRILELLLDEARRTQVKEIRVENFIVESRALGVIVESGMRPDSAADHASLEIDDDPIGAG